jgi:SAM-dependent methyltransferase
MTRLRQKARQTTVEDHPPGSLLPELYRMERGWATGMIVMTTRLLQQGLTGEEEVVEIGCGNGNLLYHYAQFLPNRRLYGIDLHPEAIDSTQRREHPSVDFAQADLHDLPFSTASVGAVLALDALDQGGVNLAEALSEVRRILRPGGLFFMRVSAHPWLYSTHDIAFNTQHRHERGQSIEALQKAGFVIERATYANFLFSPAAIATRMLQKWRIIPFASSMYHNPLLNHLVEIALRLETRWLRAMNLPFGLSLLIIARRAS